MKMTLAILGVMSLASVAWAGEQSSASSTNVHSGLASYGFVYVEPSPEQRTNLDAALMKVKLERKMGGSCETIEDARALLWRSVNIAVVFGSKRTCTEYKGFFWFSRLDWAKEDDRTFRSGLAVKRGTGEIFHWEEQKAQDGAANGSQPIRSETNRTSSAAGSRR
jgi:hypothetical protein